MFSEKSKQEAISWLQAEDIPVEPKPFKFRKKEFIRDREIDKLRNLRM